LEVIRILLSWRPDAGPFGCELVVIKRIKRIPANGEIVLQFLCAHHPAALQFGPLSCHLGLKGYALCGSLGVMVVVVVVVQVGFLWRLEA